MLTRVYQQRRLKHGYASISRFCLSFSRLSAFVSHTRTIDW